MVILLSTLEINQGKETKRKRERERERATATQHHRNVNKSTHNMNRTPRPRCSRERGWRQHTNTIFCILLVQGAVGLLLPGHNQVPWDVRFESCICSSKHVTCPLPGLDGVLHDLRPGACGLRSKAGSSRFRGERPVEVPAIHANIPPYAFPPGSAANNTSIGRGHSRTPRPRRFCQRPR